MKQFLVLSLLLVSISIVSARNWNVGPEREYKSPSAVANLVSDGDTINIDAGLYSADVCVWRASRIVLQGTDKYAHLRADGAYAEHKAIWVIKGDSCVVRNIEFSGCRVPDKNGAGIRMEGTDMYITNCYFHDNEDGILTTNDPESDLLIEYTIFAGNGFGDGYSHNMYINHINSFTMRYCYSHHANIGHTVKTRAHNTYIENCMMSDGWDGKASMLVDIPNGGNVFLVGNVFVQAETAENSKMITFGSEGYNNPERKLHIANNTFINYRYSTGYIGIWDGYDYVICKNNIFAGEMAELQQELMEQYESANNYYEDDIEEMYFRDSDSFDYHLTASSPVINYGAEITDFYGHDMTPVYQYLHTAGREDRPGDAPIDAGAYEFKGSSTVMNEEEDKSGFMINGTYIMQTDSKPDVEVYDLMGRKYRWNVNSQYIGNGFMSRVSPGSDSCKSGIYIFIIKTDEKIEYKKIYLHK